MTDFHGDQAKKKFFKIANNSQNFFVKISWIGPWVSRINWCEGHWRGSGTQFLWLPWFPKNQGGYRIMKTTVCIFILKALQLSSLYSTVWPSAFIYIPALHCDSLILKECHHMYRWRYMICSIGFPKMESHFPRLHSLVMYHYSIR